MRDYPAAVRRVLLDIQARTPLETLADITPIDLAEWRRRRAEKVKPATLNLEIHALRRFFRWAAGAGLVPDSPAERLRTASPGPRLAPRWLERPEQLRLVRAAQRAARAANTPRRRRLALRDAALVLLLLHTGLRVSEACALDLAHVQLGERSGSVRVQAGKGGKFREVPLNRDARAALGAWIDARGPEPGPLFLNDDGGRLSPRGAQQIVARLGRAAGLDVTPHQLRHTFCHELVRRGIPLDRIALLAGHTTASGRPNVLTTVRYTTPSPQELRQAVESLEWS